MRSRAHTSGPSESSWSWCSNGMFILDLPIFSSGPSSPVATDDHPCSITRAASNTTPHSSQPRCDFTAISTAQSKCHPGGRRRRKRDEGTRALGGHRFGQNTYKHLCDNLLMPQHVSPTTPSHKHLHHRLGVGRDFHPPPESPRKYGFAFRGSA